MKLPNGEQAYVEPNKINGYLLSDEHPVGGPKAAFFKAFGFTRENDLVLNAALLRHAIERDVAKTRETEYGTSYELTCEIVTPDMRNPCIKSVWIIEHGQEEPRLITAHPD